MLARILAAAVLLLAIVGCEGEPKFDPAASYSPESLASEFAFRYKELDPNAPAVKPSDPDKEVVARKKAAGPATKKAMATTLPELLDETIEKTATVPGMTPAEARSKLAGILANDPTIREADKKTIADRLASAKD